MDRTMKTMMVVLSISLFGVTTVGCGASLGARGVSVIRRGAYSGELAMTGSVVQSHYAAELAMLDHCEGRVRIVDATQGAELAVIDASESDAKSNDTVTERSERVHYVCVSRAPEQD